jgi:hypothetical protein
VLYVLYIHNYIEVSDLGIRSNSSDDQKPITHVTSRSTGEDDYGMLCNRGYVITQVM